MEDVCQRKDKARQKRDILVNPEGEWGEWVEGSLAQSRRPHIWYFAVSDCDGALQNFTHRLKFEFKATQDGGSEFSVEMKYMPHANWAFLAGLSYFVWVFIVQTRTFSKSAGSVHPVDLDTLRGHHAAVRGPGLPHAALVALHLRRQRYQGAGGDV
eukprot:SRR837773.14299.p2 GENE.SRR837773.14299~~SRR837773.14299.p2  ORF type:complete len:181 (-),score=68.22 SRR837773.14299:346-813(-)